MTEDAAGLEAARQRMLDADDAKRDDTDRAWHIWQQAATTYWLMLHPSLQHLRRGDPRRTPSVAEILERAQAIELAMVDIPRDWRLRPPAPTKVEHLARVGWFHELMAGLYEPLGWAIAHLGDEPSALETLLRFLEADPYCHRSGYAKADVIRALERIQLHPSSASRLRAVLLRVVDGPDRREFRAYVRLARRLDDGSLRAEIAAMAASGDPRRARHARWVLEGLDQADRIAASHRGQSAS